MYLRAKGDLIWGKITNEWLKSTTEIFVLWIRDLNRNFRAFLGHFYDVHEILDVDVSGQKQPRRPETGSQPLLWITFTSYSKYFSHKIWLSNRTQFIELTSYISSFFLYLHQFSSNLMQFVPQNSLITNLCLCMKCSASMNLHEHVNCAFFYRRPISTSSTVCI